MTRSLALMGLLGVAAVAWAGESRGPTAAQRGEKALLGRAFTPPAWTPRAYEAVWKRWPGAGKDRPADFDAAFRARYGLHPAPYPNHGLPMGLRQARGLLTNGLTTDCMLCHGGSIFGTSYVGLGNASLDIQAFFEDLAGSQGLPGKTPHVFSHVRGTSEAGAMAVYLHGFRNPDLTLRDGWVNLGVRDDLCEDTPAWWLLKKKKTMYHTGGADQRSVRSIMQFMLTPLNPPSAFFRDEATFADIREYLLSLSAPKYPLPIDAGLAKEGAAVFAKTCARCHGTYGEGGAYPNRIVPIEEIGTDPSRHQGIPRLLGEVYNRSWFAQERAGWLAAGYLARETPGYQAPPLDGLWATAPYFHNGSVPTVADVLNSRARPKVFTRSYRTEVEDYDPVKLGWRVQVLGTSPDPALPALERRKVYDTTKPGRGNGGHTYGDELTDAQRTALIEYLKTL
jgi:hypothetical protein